MKHIIVTFIKYRINQQERFLLLPSSKSKVSSYKWWIPLSYTKNFRTVGMTWMSDRHSSAVLKPTIDVQKDEWIIFNVNQTGFLLRSPFRIFLTY